MRPRRGRMLRGRGGRKFWPRCHVGLEDLTSLRKCGEYVFRDTTFHLALALFASLHHRYGTRYLLTSANPTHSSYRRHRYFHSAYPAVCGPTMSPGSFLRFWRYINPSLTYVLIYLLILWLYSKWTIEICLVALLK